MLSFESLFRKSKGQPVIYKGRLIQMIDRFSLADGQNLRVTFESADAEWRQGICLTTDQSFEVNGQIIRKSVVLWYDTAPREVVLKVHTGKGECQIRNVWDVGDGVTHSWHNGAAMIVEEHGGGKRYRCNDGRADDDFDDIVFLAELA